MEMRSGKKTLEAGGGFGEGGGGGGRVARNGAVSWRAGGGLKNFR